jgi:hypothetical protein
MVRAMTDLLSRLLALAELAVSEALEFEYGDPEDRHIYRELQELKPLVATALSQPEPEGPTDDELLDLANDHGVSTEDIGPLVSAILTRWGGPAIEPVPVSERPWERKGWCNANGQCWMGDGGGSGFVPSWRLCKPSDSCLPWSLPHHALPVPQP